MNEAGTAWQDEPTARDGGTGAAPRPAGRATPEPAASVVPMPPVAGFPSRAVASAGGGDSTERDTIWEPRRIVKPRVRFASCSTVWLEPLAPSAPDFCCFDRIRRNSSVSASTRFMCLSKASIWPVICRPSLRVTRIRQLICQPELAFGPLWHAIVSRLSGEPT